MNDFPPQTESSERDEVAKNLYKVLNGLNDYETLSELQQQLFVDLAL